ncbi:hypothetical protein AAE478_001921 [Parahypoxylon ruwenzoriense]
MELRPEGPLSLSKISNEGIEKDALKPVTLVLVGQSIVSETSNGIPLYQLSWDVTSIPLKGSSVLFEQVLEDDLPLEVGSTASTKQRNKHIFYLTHPADAQYRADTPAYCITSVSPETLGNISLETSKPRFQKTEFKALLSAKKNASDVPLFDKDAKLLFDVRPKWVSSRYTWTDCNGGQVAYEEGKGGEHKLVVTMPMNTEVRDALVAAWCLRLWYDTAESREAKRDAMERLTPPEGMQGYGNSQMEKRIGALGSLAGAGA